MVIDDQGFHTQSDAALRVAATLKKPALNVMATAFSPVPSPLRDGVYRLVANNRYSILGKDESGGVESCKLRADAMTVQERFLAKDVFRGPQMQIIPSIYILLLLFRVRGYARLDRARRERLRLVATGTALALLTALL